MKNNMQKEEKNNVSLMANPKEVKAATPLHKAMEYETAVDGGAPRKEDHQRRRTLLCDVNFGIYKHNSFDLPQTQKGISIPRHTHTGIGKKQRKFCRHLDVRLMASPRW